MKDEKQNNLGELLENTRAVGEQELSEDEVISLEDRDEFERLDAYAEDGALIDLTREITTVLNTLEEEDFDRKVVARWLFMQMERHLTGAAEE